MNKTQKFIMSTIAVLTCGSLYSLPSGQTSSGAIADAWDESADTCFIDSVAIIRDSLVNLATESYKNVALLKADAADYDMIYPNVYQCYEYGLNALASTEPKSEGWQRAKDVLIAIDNDLEVGAYYYSSKKNQAELDKFAQAFIDIQLLDEMKDVRFRRDPDSFPIITYIASTKAYNSGRFDKAIDYFDLYISTGDTRFLEDIYRFMGKACNNTKQYELATMRMLDALKLYPDNYDIMHNGIVACTNGGHAELLHKFLTPALEKQPESIELLQIQGKLYEDDGEYQKALDIFNQIEVLSPKKLWVAKHMALCYFNMAVSYFNDAVYAENEKLAKKSRHMSKNYFMAASQKLEDIVASDPMATKYLKALGTSYLCLEEKEKFDNVNRQLAALGENALSDVFMPQVVSYNETGNKNYDRVVGTSDLAVSDEAPLYSDFGKNYISTNLSKFIKKGEFERTEDYTKRVNDRTIAAEYDRLNEEAKEKYLELYANKLRLNDLHLQPYDATNETFLIESSYGPITIKVPLKDKEAEMFRSNWGGAKLRNPKYTIVDDEVRIAGLYIMMPNGKNYVFDNEKALAYKQDKIKIDLESILSQTNGESDKQKVIDEAYKVVTVESDVDVNIPKTNKVAQNSFVLIIANEDYERVAKVPSAIHDGDRFADYCYRTLGIPQKNIRVLKNATYGHIVSAIRQLKSTVNAFDNSEIIFYYAGHGVSDEDTMEGYLFPSDGDPNEYSACYSLKRLYSELNDMNCDAAMVFLDCCFSGESRDGKMLASARGVVIPTKEVPPQGNMFVLTAASSKETAHAYTEKNHGLFTYYLLKKLQESKGNATLKEIADYVTTNVKQQSNLINHKAQNPTSRRSGKMVDDWSKRKLHP